MRKFDSELEKAFYLRLSDSLTQFPKSGLSIVREDRWVFGRTSQYFDIALYKGNHPLVLIEIKGRLTNSSLTRTFEQIYAGLHVTNARFGVVTDNEKFYLYDRKSKGFDFKTVSYEQLILTIFKPDKIRFQKESKELVVNIFRDAANIFLKDNSDINELVNSKSFLSKFEFNNDSNTFIFNQRDGGIASFENQFFLKLFGDFKEKEISRYTSLNTLFSMLNYNSFRMNGIVGMNDKTEVNYVDTYLSDVEKPLIKQDFRTIMATNNRYITSCTDVVNKDNLTMWRLYAEDSAGVCLTFKTRLKKLNNHVLLQRVKYADKDGNHKELDFLKMIIHEIEDLTGFQFEFRKLGYWKHFFKPFEYSIEDEIRLLVIDNDSIPKIKSDWVMTHSHSIFNPIIDFRLNSSDFPIQLTEIMLGPKCPEQETNKVQIEELIRRKKRKIKDGGLDSNLNTLKVVLSDIKHYR